MVNNLKDIFYEDTYIREILLSTSSIAVVGLSDKQNRPSYYAASYLQSRGYKIIPINPSTSNKKILGEKVYKSVFDLNAKPDMIDIFLKQEKISNVTKEASVKRVPVPELLLYSVNSSGVLNLKRGLADQVGISNIRYLSNSFFKTPPSKISTSK